MSNELDKLIKEPPLIAKWEDIDDLDHIDERVSIANMLFANIVGMNEGYIEWCPNDDPPSQDEILAWLWVAFPRFGKEIFDLSGPELREEILNFQEED